MFQFVDFSWIDIIDILLVGLIIYQLYRIIRGTVAVNVFIGLLAIYLFWKSVTALQLGLLSELIGKFMEVGFLAIVILFQQEIRRFLIMIGSTKLSEIDIFSKKKSRKRHYHHQLKAAPLAEACFYMAETYTGALIVVKKHSANLKETSGGEKQNIELSSSILESIFFKNSPLHDGAVIIEDNYIVATRVMLPLSSNHTLPENYGMRHRAALGITEKSNAFCIVVSEERGEVVFVKGSTIKSVSDKTELEDIINEEIII